MAIPGFQTIMLPLLKFLGDQQEHSLGETTTAISDEFNLDEQERKELLPSGRYPVIRNRVGWAKHYMAKAGLIEVTRRAHFRISERGLKVLRDKPERIDVKFLQQFPEFVEFRSIRKDKSKAEIKMEDESETPEEALESAYERLRSDLEAELLDHVKALSPELFERLVVELLLKMGYGGSRQDAGQAIGKSGDGGIDGIIKEDRLGLDVIYIQAKKWDSTVGRPEIQKFAGALQGNRAKKGIFITTADFSSKAVDYASRIESKIVLIGGNRLTQLMFDNGLGVSTIGSYEVKKLDSDYFGEE